MQRNIYGPNISWYCSFPLLIKEFMLLLQTTQVSQRKENNTRGHISLNLYILREKTDHNVISYTTKFEEILFSYTTKKRACKRQARNSYSKHILLQKVFNSNYALQTFSENHILKLLAKMKHQLKQNLRNHLSILVCDTKDKKTKLHPPKTLQSLVPPDFCKIMVPERMISNKSVWFH